MVNVHNILLGRAYRIGVSPLTASLAKQMILPDDSEAILLACWWIALKFEEVEWNEYIVATGARCGLSVTYKEMIKAEAVVLQRNNFCVPFRTKIRSIWELLEMNSKFTYSWLYALIHCGMDNMYTPSEWAQIIKDQKCGKYVPVVLNVLCRLIPPVMAKHIENRSPRLTLKRKREDVGNTTTTVCATACFQAETS